MRRVLGLAFTIAGLAVGQAFAPTGSLKFEVASVKPSQPGTPAGGVRPAPGGQRYVGTGVPLRSYLYVAYQVKEEQIAGGPAWADTELYDLNAEAEKPTNIEELHIMLQNILTERFKLRFHFEKKETSAYVLTVDKDGPRNLKLHPSPSGGDVILDRVSEGLVHDKWTAHCASIDFFVWRFSAWFDRPMINQTGLKGCFDFELSFTRELPRGVQEGQLIDGVPVDTYGPTVYQALPKQLGLKLEAKRAPVDTMVIDHAERPVEN
jgi:bla regulator protein blaR1